MTNKEEVRKNKVRERSALFASEHPEKVKEYGARYYAKHKEKIKKKTAIYSKNNPEKATKWKARWYAKKKQRELESASYWHYICCIKPMFE